MSPDSHMKIGVRQLALNRVIVLNGKTKTPLAKKITACNLIDLCLYIVKAI